jgi:hypothetical protein
MFDIAQAAIGMDGSGPSLITPKGYNGQKFLSFKYLDGIEMTEQPYIEEMPNAQGIKFIGTKGWIEVARGYLGASDPSLVPKELAGRSRKQMTAEERKKIFEEMQKSAAKGGGSFEISAPHMQNFIDSVRSRMDPIAPVEIGCSTNTLCCLGNIATELGRPVKWNPATLSFGDDKEAAAHRLNSYEYKNPYKL